VSQGPGDLGHLQKLVASSLQATAVRAAQVPLAEIRRLAEAGGAPRPFSGALAEAGTRGAALICEVKRASPSKGPIRPDLDPAALARAYEAGGGACLSVLTEGAHFQGSLQDLVQARAACGLPVLRKDFLVTPYQLYEARAYGADAVLLIAAALAPGRLAELRALAKSLSLCVLCEIHEEEELEAAAACAPDLLGINARSLKTLAVDPLVFSRLAPQARAVAPLVAESGLKSPADLPPLHAAGAAAYLIGESLSAAADPAQATRAFARAIPPAAARCDGPAA
jgi:indole-3-glycerol phosphate synthase